MFEIGDYVLNATNGICKISEIVELDMSGDKKLKSYFLLRPVEEENDRVYIPVDNADKRIRKVITQDEAQAVLDSYGEGGAMSEESGSKAEEDDTQKEEDLPNIIVMMNESFSDLSVLGDFETNEDYMPFIHSLEQG